MTWGLKERQHVNFYYNDIKSDGGGFLFIMYFISDGAIFNRTSPSQLKKKFS